MFIIDKIIILYVYSCYREIEFVKGNMGRSFNVWQTRH